MRWVASRAHIASVSAITSNISPSRSSVSGATRHAAARLDGDQAGGGQLAQRLADRGAEAPKRSRRLLLLDLGAGGAGGR